MRIPLNYLLLSVLSTTLMSGKGGGLYVVRELTSSDSLELMDICIKGASYVCRGMKQSNPATQVLRDRIAYASDRGTARMLQLLIHLCVGRVCTDELDI